MANFTDAEKARIDYDVALAKHRHELARASRPYLPVFDEQKAFADAVRANVADAARGMVLDADPLNNDSYRRGADAAQRFLAKDALSYRRDDAGQSGTREEASAASKRAEEVAAQTRAANAAAEAAQAALNGGGEYAAMSPEEREYRAALAQQKLEITQSWRH